MCVCEIVLLYSVFRISKHTLRSSWGHNESNI